MINYTNINLHSIHYVLIWNYVHINIHIIFFIYIRIHLNTHTHTFALTFIHACIHQNYRLGDSVAIGCLPTVPIKLKLPI